jgi:glycosyltransferase involved in cell wall biosynthesis
MKTINKLGTLFSGLSLAFLAAAYRKQTESLNFGHFITLPDDELPGLSIVIAAKDESLTIGPALDSLLELDYPDLEIVLLDDRSEDNTYEIAQSRVRGHRNGHRLKLLRCEHLPDGWLGKVHALHLGAKETSRPLILFTDADVVFEKGSLQRAVSAQQILHCDHLVVAPQMETRGFWEPLLVAFFLILFAVRFQPGRVHRRKKSYVGIGAFNLLTRATLESCQYLEPLKLQVTDDVHLGRLIKSQGGTQYCIVAEKEIRVRWFEGLWGCISGLEKNAYAGLNYSLGFSALAIPGVMIPALLPLALCSLGQFQWAGAYLLFLFLLGLSIPDSCHLPRWVGLFFPLAAVILGYTFTRSVWLAEKRQGIIWRDTHYPLQELRREHRWFLEQAAPL